jgi:hypothetical protein
VLVLALAFVRSAAAQDGVAPGDEPVPDDEEEDIDVAPGAPRPQPSTDGWDFEQQKEKLVLEDDDEAMHDFVADEKKKAPPPDWWHVDPAGKAPLSDSFDIQVVAYNDAYVVVELPVLVSIGRAAFAAEHPGGIVVVGEITSGGQKVVQRQDVTPDAVLEAGPTLIFLKAALPNPAKAGDVRFLVKTGELPAPPPVADPAAPKTTRPPPPPPPPAPPKDRYARTTVFMRK